MTTAPWLVDVLRGAGLQVVEHDGWQQRGHGGFTSKRIDVVWHHDASAKGDSPGVPAYMLRNWNTAGAQLWVDRRGVWYVLAAGVAYHAGRTLPGKPGNRQSLGVETDHTTGEDWPPALLASLRLGTAAILARTGGELHMHKTICAPVGRKTDPDGLELAAERLAVRALRAGTHLQEDDMPLTDDDATLVARKVWQLAQPTPGVPLSEHTPLTLLAGARDDAGAAKGAVLALAKAIADDDAQAVAAAIPAGMAAAVVDELAKRLA